MAGSPVFLSILAPLNQFLFDHFGWRGSFLILGGVVLNCCVAGSLMRPIKIKTKLPASKTTDENDAGKLDVTPQTAGQNKSKQSGCAAIINQFIDVSLFKHRGFLIYLVGNVLMFFGFFAPVVFLAPYAKHQGIDEYSAAFLLSIFALVDMFARPGTGLVANTRWIRPKIQYFFSFAVIYNGLCHMMCPLLPGYSGLVVYAVFFGLAFGMVCALLFETLMDLVGAQRFSSAVGLATIIECGPVLLGPPISGKSNNEILTVISLCVIMFRMFIHRFLSSGLLVDIFMDYKYMYFACGIMMLAGGIFLFIMNYYNYRWLEKEQNQRKMEGLEIGSAKELAANEEDKDNEEEIKLSTEEEVGNSSCKEL